MFQSSQNLFFKISSIDGEIEQRSWRGERKVKYDEKFYTYSHLNARQIDAQFH